MMTRKLFNLGILTLLLALTACHTSKTTGVNDINKTEYTHSDDRLKSVIEKNNTEWEVISVPVKLELKSPSNLSASARAYICRDSSIFFSIRFLGMEVAAIDITTDSIIAVDKYHKYYAAERLADVFANVSFDINSIQSLLFAHPFTHTAHITDVKQASLFKTESSESNLWTAFPKKQNPLADYTFTFGTENNMPVSTLITTAIGNITALYTTPEITSVGTAPKVTNINVNSKKIKAELALKWSWKDVRTDNPADKKHLTVPDGYKRINAAALLKAFTN